MVRRDQWPDLGQGRERLINDYIFAAFSEEFGLAAVVVLLLGFTFLVFRGLMIAAEAPTVFTRGDAQLLHLCVRQYEHGQRHLAGGGCAFAVHQLRRHSDGDTGPRPGHLDVGGAKPQADAKLERLTKVAVPGFDAHALRLRSVRRRVMTNKPTPSIIAVPGSGTAMTPPGP